MSALVKVILFVTIATLIPSCSVVNSSLNRYDTFPCKNKVFTNKQPMRVYTFRYDNSFHSKILPYNFEPDDGTFPIGGDRIEIIKTYPIGSEFKFEKVYSHYSFDSGGSTDFIVEAEDGIKAWLNSHNVNINECGLDYFYELNWLSFSSPRKRASLSADTVTNPVVKPYHANEDLKAIRQYSLENNGSTEDEVLRITLPHEDYYHFTKKILEQHATNIRHFKIVIESNQGNDLPIFNLNGYTFTPLQCQSDFSDMYACFEYFDSWLSNPYPTSLPIKISSPDEVKSVIYSLNKDTSLVVGYLKNFEYMDYLRFLKGVKRIQTHFTTDSNNSTTDTESNSTVSNKKKIMLIVGKKEGLALKKGFNILDQSGSVIGHYFFLHPELVENLNSYNLYDP